MIRNRNNILCMVVSFCLLLSLFVYRPPMVSAASGTQNDPILIASASDFDRIRNGLDKHYKIADSVARITLPAGFRMIAEDGAFTGSLDGNGKTVSVSTLSTNLSPDAALFYRNAGVIKNLKLELTADISGMMAASIAVYNGSWKHAAASLTQLPGQITGCTVTSKLPPVSAP